MKLRYYAAFVTGALAEVVTLIGLWAFTKMQLHNMLAWAFISYCLAALAVLCATQPRHQVQRRIRKAPQMFTISPPKDGIMKIPVEGCPDMLEYVPVRTAGRRWRGEETNTRAANDHC